MKRRARVLLWLALLAVAGAALVAAIERAALPPRLVAAYLERRAEGHASFSGDVARALAQWLVQADRQAAAQPLRAAFRVGATKAMPAASALGREPAVIVDTPDALREAIAQAVPGAVITLLPGRYRFDGAPIEASRPGSAGQAITVRAQVPGSATLEFDQTEAFLVSAPYWTFENLDLRGVCQQHSHCEHGFHVVNQAKHFVARNNTLRDFNAHFKINGDRGAMPDGGLIEGNTLSNGSVRQTDNPVTLIDLVAASDWLVRGNLIADFAKGGGDQTSYGAFAKGGGRGNRFVGNIVLCEHRLGRPPGRRVGLSFGGGGSDKNFCRDRQCITEHDEGVIESNLVAFCSDEGIYINRSARSRVLHNTLVDTAGIGVHYAQSSVELEGNLIDGLVRPREQASVHGVDNIDTAATRLYLGSHPVRALFAAPEGIDFAWRDTPPRRAGGGTVGVDLCGQPRPAQPAYGAFEDFTACVLPPAQARP